MTSDTLSRPRDSCIARALSRYQALYQHTTGEGKWAGDEQPFQPHVRLLITPTSKESSNRIPSASARQPDGHLMHAQCASADTGQDDQTCLAKVSSKPKKSVSFQCDERLVQVLEIPGRQDSPCYQEPCDPVKLAGNSARLLDYKGSMFAPLVGTHCATIREPPLLKHADMISRLTALGSMSGTSRPWSGKGNESNTKRGQVTRSKTIERSRTSQVRSLGRTQQQTNGAVSYTDGGVLKVGVPVENKSRCPELAQPKPPGTPSVVASRKHFPTLDKHSSSGPSNAYRNSLTRNSSARSIITLDTKGLSAAGMQLRVNGEASKVHHSPYRQSSAPPSRARSGSDMSSLSSVYDFSYGVDDTSSFMYNSGGALADGGLCESDVPPAHRKVQAWQVANSASAADTAVEPQTPSISQLWDNPKSSSTNSYSYS